MYSIPEQPETRIAPEERLRSVLKNWVAGIASSVNLVVLHTPPGSAHVVASALDRAGLTDVLGTVAGDDTVLVVAHESTTGARLSERLRTLAGWELTTAESRGAQKTGTLSIRKESAT